jgi:hypothetical protein
MTDQEEPKKTEDKKDNKDLTDEEIDQLRQKKIQERIAELRKRDPFIYR